MKYQFAVLLCLGIMLFGGCAAKTPEQPDETKPEQMAEELIDEEHFFEMSAESAPENIDTEESNITGTYLDDTIYIGTYLDSYSSMDIVKGDDDKYVVDIGLHRLTSLTGIGELTDEGMKFTATDAAGNPISGVITVEDQTATVTFTNSTWDYLPNGSTYMFTKSSNRSYDENPEEDVTERNKEKYGDIVQVIYEQNQEDISAFFEYYPDTWQRWIAFSTFDFTRDGQMEIMCSYVYVQTSSCLSYNFVYDMQGNKLFEFVSGNPWYLSIYKEEDDLHYYIYCDLWFGANTAVDIYEEVSKTESWDVEIKYVEWDTRDGKGINENQQQGYHIYSDFSQEEKDLFMKKNYWEGMLQVFKNKEPCGTAEQVGQYSEIYKSLPEDTVEQFASILSLEDGVIWREY